MFLQFENALYVVGKEGGTKWKTTEDGGLTVNHVCLEELRGFAEHAMEPGRP
jgi:hypothetical protein